MKKLIPAVAVLLLATGAATVATAAVPPDVAEYARTFERFPATKGQGSESERLRKLFDLFWDFQMHASPEYATYVGFPGLDDRWTDLSPESIELRPPPRPAGPGGPGVDRPLAAQPRRAGQLRPGAPSRRAGDRRGEVPRRVPAGQPVRGAAAGTSRSCCRSCRRATSRTTRTSSPACAASPPSSTRRSRCSTAGSRRGSRRRG